MTVNQTQFARALLDPTATIPEGLVDPNGNPAGKRFDVYRNNVVVSLMDAMETAFPVIQKLLGEQNFRNLSALYVRQNPPETPVLMFYGSAFPTFLEGFEPLAHLQYLADVARLELARRSSYHAADIPSVASDTLAKLPPEKLMECRLSFAPAMQILQSPFPIASIWDFNMIKGAAKPEPVSQSVLVTRPEMDLEMQVISDDQYLFIQNLAAGRSLGEAYEAVTEANSSFDLSAAIILMLESEVITKTNS